MVDYGSDLSLVDDLTPNMTVVSGLRLVGEAIARRLQTPHGALLDDSLYGFDVTGLVNADMSTGDVAALNAGIRTECLKDQRVTSAKVTSQFIEQVPPSLGYLEITISLGTSSGPFKLVLAADQVTVAILQTGA
jgi:hypothetical protein